MRTLEVGAAGFITKTNDSAVLLEKIKNILTA
jgi:DNA-binding NarL/FixJ family response regulator